MPRQRLREVACAIGAAILIIAFWKYRLSDPADGIAIQSRDAFQQIYPMWDRAAAWLHAGEVPLWNPYQLGGNPFAAAVLYGVFYPLNVARLFLPTAAAMEATLVLHLAVAWLFTFLFARALGLTLLAACTAAFVYALAGNTVLDATWLLSAAGAIVWIPLALLAIEKIVEERRALWAVVLGVAVAMPILAGWLQDWLHLVHAVAIYAGIRVASLMVDAEKRRRVPAVCGLLALGVVLGVSLAAVQLIPSMELQSLGWRRPGGLTLEQSLPGGPSLPGRWFADAADSAPGFPRYGYVGIAAVLLLPLAAFAATADVRVTALWTLGLWGLLVAMTVATPVFTLYREIPGGKWFREPWRIIVLYSFAVAVLSGVAIDFARGASRRRGTIAALLSTAFAVGWSLVTPLPPRTQWLIVASLALIWLAVALPLSWRRLPLAALALLLTFDLFSASFVRAQRPYQNPKAVDGEAPLLDYIAENQGLQRTFLFHPWPFDPAIMPKQGTLRGIYMVTDYEILTLDRQGKYYSAIETGRANATPGSFIGLLRPFLPNAAGMRLLDLMSVRFVLAPKKQDVFAAIAPSLDWTPLFVPVASDYAVYRNNRALPRAYVAYNRMVVEDDKRALGVLTSERFHPWKEIVLERGAGDPFETIRSAREISATPISVYDPSRVVVDAVADQDGLLVLTDTFYPGWNAYVDGVQRPIYRANYLFRAVPISAGVHTVEFRFEPLSFRIGALVSLLAAAIMTALAAGAGGRLRRIVSAT